MKRETRHTNNDYLPMPPMVRGAMPIQGTCAKMLGATTNETVPWAIPVPSSKDIQALPAILAREEPAAHETPVLMLARPFIKITKDEPTTGVRAHAELWSIRLSASVEEGILERAARLFLARGFGRDATDRALHIMAQAMRNIGPDLDELEVGEIERAAFEAHETARSERESGE